MEDNISGGTVNYDIVGEGIPIVMLHGGPGDLLYMKGLMEPVFQEHSNWQRLYLDLPGCGLTKTDETVKSYDDVLEFVLEFITQQLPDRRFALAGHSYGGYLARGIIHRWSNRVSGLCLITPRIVQVRDKKIVPEHATLFAEPGFREYLTPEEEWMTDYLLDSPFESPTLIITGRQDRVTGYQDAWDLIENIPRATFAVLDRASHFLSYCRALP